MKINHVTAFVASLLLVVPVLAQAEIQGDVNPNQNQSSCINLQNNLQYRSTDATTGGEVSQLQDFLQSRSYLSSEPTGYFGLLTQVAVKRFQTASGILSSGYVGPITRGKIQSASCSSGTANPSPSPLPSGCRPGDIFSPTTGQRCNAAVACTMDAKQCPDGSYVGRQGPSCAFAACPSISTIPQITSVTGKAAGNFEVDAGSSASVTGTYLAGNYTSTTKVYIGGLRATVTYASDTLLNITIPSSLTPGRSYDFYVTNEKGTSNEVSVKVLSVVAASESATVSRTFAYQQQYGSGVEGQMNSTYTYQIKNYRSGLVLDVEPTINCNDGYITPLKRDCSFYRFDLTGKAAESYIGVSGNPHAKGGALYRFTGSSGTLSLIGAVVKVYAPPSGYIRPIPDSIDFKFILRDLNQGGKEIWSETKRAQFKG